MQKIVTSYCLGPQRTSGTRIRRQPLPSNPYIILAHPHRLRSTGQSAPRHPTDSHPRLLRYLHGATHWMRVRLLFPSTALHGSAITTEIHAGVPTAPYAPRVGLLRRPCRILPVLPASAASGPLAPPRLAGVAHRRLRRGAASVRWRRWTRWQHALSNDGAARDSACVRRPSRLRNHRTRCRTPAA